MNRSRITGNLTSHGILYSDIANDRVGIGSTIPGNKLSLPDSAKIGLGNAGDLKLYHNGTNSFIENGTGELLIRAKTSENSINCNPDGSVEIFYDNAKKFETTISGTIVTGVSTADGFSVGDNEKYISGASDDFQIYHSTSLGNVIGAVGGHTTKFYGPQVEMYSLDGTKKSFVSDSDAAVELYYNNSKKLETTNTGAVVTGILTATGNVNFAGDVYSTSNNPWIYTSNGGSGARAGINLDGTNQKIDFSTAGSSNVRLRITSVGNVGIGTGVPATWSGGRNLSIAANNGGQLELKKLSSDIRHYIWGDDNLNIGAGYHNGGSSVLRFLVNGNNERLRITSGGNVDINGTPPWTVAGGDYRNLSISGETASSSGFIWLGNGTAATNADFDLGRINFCNGGTIVARVIGSTDTSANDDGRLTFYTKKTGATEVERLRITSTGDVGINCTPHSNAGINFQIHGDNTTSEIRLTNTTTGSGNNGGTIQMGGNTLYISNSENGNTVFENNGSERLRIASTGNVGIGTITPQSARLHVYNATGDAHLTVEAPASGKDARLNLYAHNTGVSQIRLGDDTDTNIGRITYYHSASGTNEANSLEFITGDYGRVRVASTGLVLPQTSNEIRTDSSDGSDNKRIILAGGGDNSQSRGAQIAIYGNEYSSHEGRLQLLAGNSGNTNGVIQMHTGGLERLRITSAGNILQTKTGANVNLTLSRNESVGTTNQALAVIDFASNTAHTVQARLMTKSLGTSNVGGDLVVETRADGGSLDERLRIKGNGRLGIGLDGPEAVLHPRANSIHGTDTAFQVGTGNRFFKLNELSGQDNFGQCYMSFYDNSLREILTLENSYAGQTGMGMEIAWRGHGAGKTGDIRVYNTAANSVQSKMDMSASGGIGIEIDHNGHVTKPNQPYCDVTLDTSRTCGARGVARFSDTNGFGGHYFTNVRNNQGSHYNSGNSRFTIPTTGKYLICMNLALTGSNPDAYLAFEWYKNGSRAYYGGWQRAETSGYHRQASTTIWYLSKDDYLEPSFETDETVQFLGHTNTNSRYTGFSIMLLG